MFICQQVKSLTQINFNPKLEQNLLHEISSITY